jgi:hypothetical protein
MYMTIKERIAELREYARQDGDRCNESSIADVLAFPAQIAGMDGPYLFMDESGNMRVLWRNAKRRFGIYFYGRGKARLVVLNRRNNSEVSYFCLAGIPAEVSEESFLAFVKDNVYQEPEETQPEPDQHAIR